MMSLSSSPASLFVEFLDSYLLTQVTVLVFGVVLVLALVIVFVAMRAQSSGSTASTALMGHFQKRYDQLLASGQILPLPSSIPPVPRGIPNRTVDQVLRRAQQMRSIMWGVNEAVPGSTVRQAFDAAMGRIQRARANLSNFDDITEEFVAMPAPLCYVGAAEVMMRLSYYNLSTYIPDGLLQALLFAAQAQCVTPLQPDALIVQARILASTRHPEWERLASQTLMVLDRVAPEHPRLAVARHTFHMSRHEYDQALSCCKEAFAHALTLEERNEALKRAADTLFTAKRYPEALEAYDATLESDPENEWAWHNKSLVLLALGRSVEALECNEQALALQQFGAAINARQRILGDMQMRQNIPSQTLKWT